VPNQLKNEKETQSVEIPVQIYFIINTLIHIFTFYVILALLLSYQPIMYFFHVNTLFGQTNSNILGIEDFWLYFFLPLYLIMCLVVFIGLQIGIAMLFDSYWNRKSPPTEGLFYRTFSKKDVADPRIKYYHYRGFIIKNPLWYASKSPFPWLINLVLTKVGHNVIDKSVIYIDAAPSLEFTTVKKNAVVMMGVLYSSHVIDSLYGNLTIKRVIIGENAILYPNSVFAPGTTIDKNCNMLPHTMTPKDFKTDENKKFYNGTPAKPCDHVYNGVFSRLDPKALEIFNQKGFVLGEEIENLYKNTS
jgi:hypothetical protein